jgi:hypothetical protein
MRRRQPLTRGREVEICAIQRLIFADALANMAVLLLIFNGEQVCSDVALHKFTIQPQRGNDGQDNSSVEPENSDKVHDNSHDAQSICTNERPNSTDALVNRFVERVIWSNARTNSAVQKAIRTNEPLMRANAPLRSAKIAKMSYGASAPVAIPRCPSGARGSITLSWNAALVTRSRCGHAAEQLEDGQ